MPRLEVVALAAAASIVVAVLSALVEDDPIRERYWRFWTPTGYKRARRSLLVAHATVGVIAGLGLSATGWQPFGASLLAAVANGVAYGLAGEALFRAQVGEFAGGSTTGHSLVHRVVDKLKDSLDSQAKNEVARYVNQLALDARWYLAWELLEDASREGKVKIAEYQHERAALEAHAAVIDPEDGTATRADQGKTSAQLRAFAIGMITEYRVVVEGVEDTAGAITAVERASTARSTLSPQVAERSEPRDAQTIPGIMVIPEPEMPAVTEPGDGVEHSQGRDEGDKDL